MDGMTPEAGKDGADGLRPDMRGVLPAGTTRQVRWGRPPGGAACDGILSLIGVP